MSLLLLFRKHYGTSSGAGDSGSGRSRGARERKPPDAPQFIPTKEYIETVTKEPDETKFSTPQDDSSSVPKPDKAHPLTLSIFTAQNDFQTSLDVGPLIVEIEARIAEIQALPAPSRDGEPGKELIDLEIKLQQLRALQEAEDDDDLLLLALLN